MAESSASGDSSPLASISHASRRNASSRVGTAWPGGRHDDVGHRLDEKVGPRGIGLRVADIVVDVEKDLGLGARDGNAALAAEGVKDAANQLDLALADAALLTGMALRAAGRRRR